MADASAFKLTYATMFSPPEELHTRFDEALERVRSTLGQEYGMIIDGKDHFSAEKVEDRSPANTDQVLAVFQKGSAEDANQAVAAARKAFPAWSHTPWQERIALLRRAADLIDSRIFELGVALAMEVGKNRMESLGDVAESADLIRYSCLQMEKNDGYVVEMGRDPLTGFDSNNLSILRPYGVWLVISPFNFPASLTGGPMGAALASGNTVVIKPATDTPWTVRLMAECLREAGLPDGVFNYVTGPGSTLGQALIDNPEVDGVTFTGSFEVGMNLFCNFGRGKYIRPTILELGGKNPAIVSRHANLEDAALGIVRSAFGLQGQKCSACSRVYIEKPVYEELVDRLVQLTNKLVIGDPVEGAFGKGYFCAPTLVADVPFDHHLWKDEMFVPITTVAPVSDMDEAMQRANDVNYGLTAGFYGSPDEIDWFYDHIQAGVTYANRPQGATTGAWPGFQPFGGWKGSGSTGKNAGGHYYVPLYMHEQIRTRVKRA